MELSTTSRGKAKLLWNGYVYTKHIEKNGMIQWHCTYSGLGTADINQMKERNQNLTLLPSLSLSSGVDGSSLLQLPVLLTVDTCVDDVSLTTFLSSSFTPVSMAASEATTINLNLQHYEYCMCIKIQYSFY